MKKILLAAQKHLADAKYSTEAGDENDARDATTAALTIVECLEESEEVKVVARTMTVGELETAIAGIFEAYAENPITCPRCQGAVKENGKIYYEKGKYDGKRYREEAGLTVHQCKVCKTRFAIL